MPVRRALGVRSVFNVLGPLLNPAGARRQVMGVYAGRLVPTVAAAMALLDTDHALVVHGDGGLDELAVPVGDVVYQASQAWPFPAGIMLGFRAGGVQLGQVRADLRIDAADVRLVAAAMMRQQLRQRVGNQL